MAVDTRRIVDVAGRTRDGGTSFGSGCLIGSGLVLTARHVVADRQGRPLDGLTVRMPEDGRPWPCEVAWTGPADTDVAVLRVTEPGSPSWEPVRWGELVAVGTGVACEAVGFPLAMRQAGGLRDTEHLSGTINTGTGLLGGRIHVTADSAPPRDGEWAGMSGAALFCGPLLIGVIVEDPPSYGSRRLVAEPVARLWTMPGFPEVAGQGRTLEAVGLTGRRPPAGAPSPAYLLRADAQVVRFRSRGEELARLATWCAGLGFGIRLITGPGGQGKTRLACELGNRLRSTPGSPWLVTWWESGDPVPALDGLTRPTLVVVDYAETRPVTALLDLVRAATAQAPRAPARLLLLARGAGDWWQRLIDEDARVEAVLRGAATEELAALEEDLAGREAAYTEALTDLADGLTAMGWPHTPAEQVPVPDLTKARFTRGGAALTQHMTALAGLLGDRSGTERPVEEVILTHERRYWRKTAEEHRVGLSDQSLRRAVAAAALCGAGSEPEALALLTRVPGLRDPDEDRRIRVYRWLRDLYPPPADGSRRTGAAAPGGVWGTLQPDRLAEHLIASVIDELPSFPGELLVGASAGQHHQALTVLSRVAAADHSIAGLLLSLLTEEPALAVPAVRAAVQSENPVPLVTALLGLADSGGLSFDQLAEVAEAIPVRTQALAWFAATIQYRLTELCGAMAREDPDVGLPEFAGSLNRLSGRLQGLGRYGEALQAVERSVDIWERLAARNSAAYLPNLADAVINRSTLLWEERRWDESLEAVRRAAGMYARLVVGGDSAAYRWRLATALNNMANLLGELRRNDEALELAGQAVDMYEQLALGDAAVYSGELAMALNNQAILLGACRRTEEGLATAGRAVGIYEWLAETDPDAYRPELAMSLHNLANGLAEARRWDEGLNAVVRAVEIRERLAEANPDVYLPDLASSWNTMANLLGRVERKQDGLATARRAVGAYERLAEVSPDVYRPDLAMSLNNLATRLAKLERWEEALSVARRAVEIRERLAEADPAVHRPPLADSLFNLAKLFEDMGRSEDWLGATTRLIAVQERLAVDDPGAYLPELADSLYDYSIKLGELGRAKEALPAARRAVEIRERLVETAPDIDVSDLVRSCLLNARLLIASEMPDEAVALILRGNGLAWMRRLNELVHFGTSLLHEAYRRWPSQTLAAWRRATPQEPPAWMTP
ncbi:tetratricopeptide repeat protein [Rhizohabitans arisaemae]|uniref:tetratricopeptide repeat protein n=1 Tax=Rhizohabitans arisaemae TaxID=2720610 RepID=UPI0024B1289B|nr:tetratricopeptide repeat protein [Rhizohabitans arisaemae]